jgi:asparagine synthase (glutamine-hydrolysing)
MCGLCGFLDTSPARGGSAEALTGIAVRMADALRHRGPDSGGAWADPAVGIGLGHRRLAILDLSPAGHQPMESAAGRYVMVFNGEVYNYKELRNDLERAGAVSGFRGHSDTEVLLAAFEAWGIEAAVRRFNGMFAIALWDRAERTLHLLRDRLGEKPLYYGWAGTTFLFGSELKALRAHPAFRGEVDRGALALLLRYNYIPAPHSIYRGFHKLPPGSVLTVRADAGPRHAEPAAYWSARAAAERGGQQPFTGTEAEAVEHLDGLLRDAVGMRMEADVPLGAFLSGGIDSSTVVALMQAQSRRAVKTFSIGFQEAGFDEARDAAAVARHLGTDHTELYLSARDGLDVIPLLPSLYDEPFSDSSQIPTFLVSGMAKRHVTVSLSGDGGDELFGGYNRYFWGQQLWDRVGRLPRSVRSGAARALGAVPPRAWDRLFTAPGTAALLPRRVRRQAQPADKIGKIADVLRVDSPEAMYRTLVSHWKCPGSVLQGNVAEPPPPPGFCGTAVLPLRMMYLDTVSYLPDDVLAKVDRASMGVSLEARVPLLDHRVAEFAWTLPLAFKIRGGQGKWALRRVLDRYVPPALIDRPKMGFGVPIGAWLRGPLRDWAEALLAPRRLEDEGFFRPAPVRARWEEHLSGRRNAQHELWDVLMFQSWWEANR